MVIRNQHLYALSRKKKRGGPWRGCLMSDGFLGCPMRTFLPMALPGGSVRRIKFLTEHNSNKKTRLA